MVNRRIWLHMLQSILCLFPTIPLIRRRLAIRHVWQSETVWQSYNLKQISLSWWRLLDKKREVQLLINVLIPFPDQILLNYLKVQKKSVTVTPSGNGKSVTVNDCHSKRLRFPAPLIPSVETPIRASSGPSSGVDCERNLTRTKTAPNDPNKTQI